MAAWYDIATPSARCGSIERMFYGGDAMRDEQAGDVVEAVEGALQRIARVICEEAARISDVAPVTAGALMRVCDALRDPG